MNLTGRAVLSCTLAAGCAASPPPPATSVERDSAGIRIVESTAQPGSAPTLRLAAEGMIQIGVIDGEPAYQLDRVNSVTRLSDGSWAVANGGSQELRVFSAAGHHLRTIGGRGQGPGEFRAISYMRRLEGDSLFVYDAQNRRISILTPDGILTREWSTTQDGTALRIVAALSDGTMLTSNWTSISQPRSAELVRDTARYEVRGEGLPVPLEQHYLGNESKLDVQEGSSGVIAISILRLPYTRTAVLSASEQTFVVGSNYTYEFHMYDAGGSLRTIVRRPDVVPATVTTELLQRHMEADLASRRARGVDVTPEVEATARRNIQNMHRVESVPAYGSIVATSAGGVWVQDFVLPGTEAEETSWATFDADGRLTGSILLPKDFRPMFVGADMAAGVIRDDFDVEYVRIYRIERGQSR
jgi:hypothetical protein